MDKPKQADLRGKLYKLFDSCKFDNGWKKIRDGPENFQDYKSLKDNAKIELQVKGIAPESYNFKKNSIIKIKNHLLKYHDKDLIE